ncbi:hypothetical protein GOBAR_AA37515 [Gossypium barbadense]|uniref:Uncharacterized protein n=1 Tax=Gossypium barbadense TaxID=3634 RepID=A0A2P5VWH6_GOSBA|nr:hypothetical protein GOBAR_AA37515 [Gossypium barbadense]
MANAPFRSAVKDNSVKTSSRVKGSSTFAARSEGKAKNANTPIDPPIVTTQVVSICHRAPLLPPLCK